MNTAKEKMVECFEEGKEKGAKYIFTEINLGPEYPATEIIVNPIDNLEEKVKYLSKTYNDELKHPHAPIEIVSYGWVEDMSQLEYAKNNFEVN